MATMVPLSEEPPRRAGCSSCSNPVADALGRAWHALQHSALLGCVAGGGRRGAAARRGVLPRERAPQPPHRPARSNMSDDTGDVSQHGEAKRLKGKDLWVVRTEI